MSRRRSKLLAAAAVLAAALCPPVAPAAETADPVPMTSTRVILKVDSDRAVPIKASFQERPPTLTLGFPAQQVVGSLPERSTVAKGAVKAIVAKYGPSAKRDGRPQRFIESVQLVLGGPYAYDVQSEPGMIIVELEHPATVSGASLEIGVRGGSIVAGINKRQKISQRFRAMQEALTRASWSNRASTAPPSPAAAAEPTSAGLDRPSPGQLIPPAPQASEAMPEAAAVMKPYRRPASSPAHAPQPSTLLTGFAALALLIAWLLHRLVPAAPGAIGGRETTARLPSGVILIDQLVWRAFERQGWTLTQERNLPAPLQGTLRIVEKEGQASGLLFVGLAPFFEKQTVERFAQTLREGRIEQGILVASGSFTVPAQRAAKAHNVTLIGRDQLAELLGSGAGSEYFTAQLQQTEAKLEEAKELLRQHATELDTLRRQRNEASWFLGEERDRTAKVESQIGDLEQQIARQQGEITRYQEEAAGLRAKWEENEWYLGESRARTQHLESQLAALQEQIKGGTEGDTAKSAELQAQLDAEQLKSAGLQLQLADLQNRLEDSEKREGKFQRELERLKQEIQALQVFGDRRSHARSEVPQAQVELYNGDELPVFTGSLKDLSSGGLGLETEAELPGEHALRVRLSLPGRDAVESKGRIMWQTRAGDPAKYRSGIRLLRLSAPVRAAIDQAVWEAQATRPN